MANPEHLRILERGAKAWNRWRSKHSSELPDLQKAWLQNLELKDANLSRVNFRFGRFGDADLRDVNFSGADLTASEFFSYCGSEIRPACLVGADFNSANLENADLSYADLSEADFTGANLVGTNLSGAKLNRANLTHANLRMLKVNNTDMNSTLWGYTVLADTDMSSVKGMDTILHGGPSTIGVDALYRSQGKIPDKFLHDAGVSEDIIDIARSLRTGPPIQLHSCFISYSTKDEEFVLRLHSRMREANMRVWCAAKDLQSGKKLHEQLFEAIQFHDRLLIVLSEHSIQSEWVMTEIRKARETEKKEKRRKLFPIRLTDFETLRDWTCFDADTGKDLAVEVREYFIPDFSNWKDHDAFESAFARLKKDLEADNSKK
jgi:TIR domain/Pentapeptide repeats (8 copies)